MLGNMIRFLITMIFGCAYIHIMLVLTLLIYYGYNLHGLYFWAILLTALLTANHVTDSYQQSIPITTELDFTLFKYKFIWSGTVSIILAVICMLYDLGQFLYWGVLLLYAFVNFSTVPTLSKRRDEFLLGGYDA